MLTAEQQAIIAAASNVDHTEDGPAFEFKVPDAGYRTARLIEYIELGKQPQSYQGVPRDPCLEVLIAFELFGNSDKVKDMQDEKDGDGNPTGRQTGTRYQLPPLTVKINERAKFKKLFLKMRNGRQDVRSMFQMLGEAFKLGLTHREVEGKDGKKGTTYANMVKDGNWLIGPALIQKKDDLGNDAGPPVKMNVPECTMPLKLFLFDHPTQESWDALFIGGSYNKDGVDVSKNRIQEKIKSATNFKGSALEAMLLKVDNIGKVPDDIPAPAPNAQGDVPEDLFDDIPF